MSGVGESRIYLWGVRELFINNLTSCLFLSKTYNTSVSIVKMTLYPLQSGVGCTGHTRDVERGYDANPMRDPVRSVCPVRHDSVFTAGDPVRRR